MTDENTTTRLSSKELCEIKDRALDAAKGWKQEPCEAFIELARAAQACVFYAEVAEEKDEREAEKLS